MADIAEMKAGVNDYAWCATCRVYNHSNPQTWLFAHNQRKHPRRWRRYLQDKWGVGR